MQPVSTPCLRMAARSCEKKVPAPRQVVSKPKSRPSSSSKAEITKKAEVRPQIKSASGPTRQYADLFLAKEEEYKLINAELEVKTADLVKQTEQLLREQSENLSKTYSTHLLTDVNDAEDSRIVKPRQSPVQELEVKVVNKKHINSTSQKMCVGKREKEPHRKTVSPKSPPVDDLGAGEDSADVFLAKTIHSMEEKMKADPVAHENAVDDVGIAVGSCVSDAQIRVLKAKLRIMQEELTQFSCEYYKKDDENAKLSAKIKELEEDRARMQKTTSIQQTQIEKHRVLAEESARKCDGLQVQVSALNKIIENQSNAQKQAAAVHSTMEVRLNRALEEVEKLKTQLNKTEQANKNKTSEDHQSKEILLAENKMLKKQKAELITGFKKQLKLIDILKRQKMHFEAARLLSFTEEEFIKALDWGKP